VHGGQPHPPFRVLQQGGGEAGQGPAGDDGANFRFRVFGQGVEGKGGEPPGDGLADFTFRVFYQSCQLAMGQAPGQGDADQVVRVVHEGRQGGGRQAGGYKEAYFAVRVPGHAAQLFDGKPLGHYPAHDFVAVVHQGADPVQGGIPGGDGAALPEQVLQVVAGLVPVVAQEAVDLPAAVGPDAGIPGAAAARREQFAGMAAAGAEA